MQSEINNQSGLKDILFFICDPKKNISCSKECCAYSALVKNPYCRMTIYPDFSNFPNEPYIINPKTLEFERIHIDDI